MKVSVETHRLLFPPGFSSEFRFKAPVDELGIIRLAKESIAAMLPQSAFVDGVLVDIKGRDAEGGWIDERQELFAISAYYKKAKEAKEEEESEPELSYFGIHGWTRFSEYTPDNHIIHKLEIEYRGEEMNPAHKELQDVFDVQGLCIDEFRLGMDFFEKSFLGSYFGFAPVVNKSFQLRFVDRILDISVYSEGLKARADNPFGVFTQLRQLDETIYKSLNMRLSAAYEEFAKK